ncbi:MAG: HhH-GPD-type base excision DNA repair protein [Solirubrobacterales bacterium]
MAKPTQLHFTDDAVANKLNAKDPMALLIGFVLDQQVTVQKAFAGPLAIAERLGSLDADTLANTDLEPIFREKPAIHRYPGNMAKRVSELGAHIAENYDGDAAKVWKSAKTSEQLQANLEALPGFGEMKVRSIAAVLAKLYGVKNAEPLVPDHPTLGDINSIDELHEYQAAKKLHKKDWYSVYGKGKKKA